MEHQNGAGGFAAGLAGFAGDVLWEVAQIGQGLLDAAVLLVVGVLIYQHGAALTAPAQPDRSAVEQSVVQGALACDSALVPAGTCIVSMPLEPAAT